jgi:hypothetical protein
METQLPYEYRSVYESFPLAKNVPKLVVLLSCEVLVGKAVGATRESIRPVDWVANQDRSKIHAGGRNTGKLHV